MPNYFVKNYRYIMVRFWMTSLWVLPLSSDRFWMLFKSRSNIHLSIWNSVDVKFIAVNEV